MTGPRSDAVRSRTKILAAARRYPLEELRLNDLARTAGVGVATVYRHFPTVPSLVEALTIDALELLVNQARTSSADPDPASAFARFVRALASMQINHSGLQSVLLSNSLSADAHRMRDELFSLAQTVLINAIEVGAVRPGLTIDQVERLICGVEHAVRLGEGDDRDLLLDVMLHGLTVPDVAPITVQDRMA